MCGYAQCTNTTDYKLLYSALRNHLHIYVYLCMLLRSALDIFYEGFRKEHINTYFGTFVCILCQYGSCYTKEHYANEAQSSVFYTTENWNRLGEWRFPWEQLCDVMEAPRA